METTRRSDLVARIMEASPGAVVHVGADGAILAANPEAIRILGYRRDDLTKRYIADWDPETFDEAGTPVTVENYPVAKVLATGKEDGPVTIGLRRPDGEVVWGFFHAVPVRENGQVTGAIVSVLDITERKRSEEALRRSEEQWRSLAESLPDFVTMLDRNARFVTVNRVLAHLRREEVVGSRFFDYIDPQYLDLARTKFDEAVGSKCPVRYENRGEGPGGQIVWYENVFVPLLGGDGEVDRVLCIARDITERRAMLASLAEKERLASVGTLAASIAHEVMNPLTYVLANLELATGNRGDEARRAKALADAREGAARMQQIVWDLRSLARTGSEELFYVDVRNVMEIAVRLVGPELTRNCTLAVEFAEVPGVLASESRLCQVFMNLLGNAAQALEGRPRSESVIRVRTESDEAAGLVAVIVEDNGVGIESSRLERVFEPFYTTKANGTGLGLSISRDIVTRMGGRIEVASEAGKGTTFTVWLSTRREVARVSPTDERGGDTRSMSEPDLAGRS